ncbi:hypothetical protein GCM10010399_46980 [Dactylosporangium fulvum]|uniref:Uncharacterized protein n=1 Tax=Dactylosporangium fulvum TaxID=53359 RepID=A0ABY5VMQ1_9ACTN|nr:hypothetical protein [Dactylosporangium fulvum]UWP78685.1 hypothetical protein Dfulv_26290 [Dactylosporangium fulvum]
MTISGISGVPGVHGAQWTPMRPDRADDARDPVAQRNEPEGGRSLGDIAREQGVSQADLAAAVRTGRPVSDAVGAAAAEDDEATERIASNRSAERLQRLSNLLDTREEDLRAASATDVARLLQDKGIDLSRLRSVLSSGDLVDQRV